MLLIALAGLLAFYGLERLAKISLARRQGAPVPAGHAPEDGTAAPTSPRVFWTHMAAFTAAVAGGWSLGLVTGPPEAGVAALTAFLGGGVVLNVLKEEVPSQRQSRFWAFAGGAAGYAALLPAL